MGGGRDGAITVLIVDPMPLARKALMEALRPCPAIDVVGTVSGPAAAERRLATKAAEALLLDLERPAAAGIEHLRQLRARVPFEVVLFTALEGTDRQEVMDAFAIPPSAVIAKPRSGLLSGTQALLPLLEAALTGAKLRRLAAADDVPRPFPLLARPSVSRVIAIGASTGGTEALATVLSGLPRLTPGLVIVQHMLPSLTASFARRLNDVGAIEVKEAQDGDPILPGRALLAPGAHHLTVQPGRDNLVARVEAGPPVNGHCPSVDVLMLSVACHVGRQSLGVLLTGMGNDGAFGMRAILEAGGITIGQDEATSTVYGMPRMALKAGGVAQVAPLPQIAGQIIASLGRQS